MERIIRGKPLKTVFVDGDKVRLFAEAFGVSLREIARRVGCDHAYLHRVLRGKQHISARYAARLVEVLQAIARSEPLAPFAFMREIAPNPPAEVRPMPALEGQAPSSEVA